MDPLPQTRPEPPCEHEKPLISSRGRVVLVLLFACLSGLGTFTFHYGEGLSYFSKDPNACRNCHIMQPQFDSWQKGSHHGFATCVDCHLPHTFVAKWIAKAENGYFHSKGFTFQDFPEPIQITPKNSRILQHNCVECHESLITDMTHGNPHADEAVSCMHCHRSVGHGDSISMGRWEATPALSPQTR
jgi:cytochrome c nitrite reductase small subunit